MAIEGLSARLYLDHNVDPLLARDLRRHGFDVKYAQQVGNQRAQDDEQLRWAAAQGRAVLTFDLDDYPPLASAWFERGEDHAGILLSVAPPLITYGELLRRLLALLDAMSAEDLVNQVLWLDESWSTSARR